MKYVFPTIVKVAECLVDALQQHITSSDNEVDIHDFMLRYNADVIGTVAYGIECNSLKDTNSEFISMGRAVISKPRHGAKFNILIHSYPNVARWLGIKFIRDDVAACFMNAIEQTVKYREENNTRRNDMMDILLQMRNQASNDALTLNEIAGHAYIFFLGGFESSSVAITNCLYELAMNSDIQTKARKVIQQTFKKHNEKFHYDMLSDLTFIERLIKGVFLF